MDTEKLKELVQRAFGRALGMGDVGSTMGEIHESRSARWVRCLADEFSVLYSGELHHVFAGSGDRHGKHCELLFDIHVSSVSTTTSVKHGATIRFITESLWAIESELAHDSAQWVSDLHKLVASNAPYKLFVGPEYEDQAAQFRLFSDVAQHCDGQIFVALLPYPEKWSLHKTQGAKVYQYQADNRGWQTL